MCQTLIQKKTEKFGIIFANLYLLLATVIYTFFKILYSILLSRYAEETPHEMKII